MESPLNFIVEALDVTAIANVKVALILILDLRLHLILQKKKNRYLRGEGENYVPLKNIKRN